MIKGGLSYFNLKKTCTCHLSKYGQALFFEDGAHDCSSPSSFFHKPHQFLYHLQFAVCFFEMEEKLNGTFEAICKIYLCFYDFLPICNNLLAHI